MAFFARLILRWAWLIAILGIVLTVPATYYSVQLYKNLRTDIEELLPTTARSVIDLKEVKSRLESIDNLGILIFSENAQANRKFVDALAARLQKIPKNVISSVEYKINDEMKFFLDRGALYVEVADLIKIREYIRDRIEYERQLYNPLNIFSEEEIPEPQLDFRALLAKYQGRTSSYSRYPDGYYGTPNGKRYAVLAYVPGENSGIEAQKHLKAEVMKAVAEVGPKNYAPDLEVKYTGSIQNMIEEHEALIEDLELSTIIVMVLVAVGMLLFYRTWRGTFALLGSLVIGTLWTFGVSYFTVGYLNANSAFLGSIVIGNGINFGIILLARYIEERRAGKNNEQAIIISISQTSTSTWTAALAAGLAYGSLILTGFRGFKQFGIIGLIGMVLCWISAFTLLPAYLTILDRWKPIAKPASKPPSTPITNAVAYVINRWPGWIWGASIIVTVASIGTLASYTPDIIETNLANLRDKRSMATGSGYLSRYLDEIFQRYLTPVVLLPESSRDAEQMAAILKARKELQGKNTLITSVQTMTDFLPQDQLPKIKVLKEIRDLLPPKMLARLGGEDRKLAEQFLNPAAFKPMALTDLPPLIVQKFTEKNGKVGNLVLVEPPLSKETWDGHKLTSFVRELREAGDTVAPGTPVAGQLPVTSDMIESVMRDGPKATLFAFLAVVLLVVLLFRQPGIIALTLFSLILGIVWLLGIILGFWLKINFLNFIALPITFGIGVDYGVNIFQRYREEGGKNILNVVRHTGGAVGLCSFTTVVGYGSLLIAGNQAFVSFGRLAVIGEATCLVAALFTLPSYLLLRHRRQARAAKA